MQLGRDLDCLFIGPGTWEDGAEAVLLRDPVEVRQAGTVEQVPDLLEAIEEATARGRYVAAYLTYEAAGAFGLPTRTPEPGCPLAWMAAYLPRNVTRPTRAELPTSALRELPPVAPELDVSEEEHRAAVGAIREWIARGHTYQVNYTVRALLRLAVDPLEYFLALAETHPVPYAAYLGVEGREIVSLSPELFLTHRGSFLESRPMKGTRPRGATNEEDRRLAAELASSEKDRAENLMIVDMVRHDLGKVACAGEVVVPALFGLERYRTVWQMTSTVRARLREGVGLRAVLEATFPGASVTGAPKLRTMEIIRELERSPRGVYTGAVGLLLPGGDFTWNLPIRTLVREPDGYHLGVGAGILWDSDARLEYAETLTKARFALRSTVGMGLFETMLLTGDGEYLYLDDHVARLRDAAEYWDYPFDESALRDALDGATGGAVNRASTGRVVRIELRADGSLGLSDRALPPPLRCPVRVLLSSGRTQADDPLLRHKTTARYLYDRERARAEGRGYAEVLFRNTQGLITEGAITNLFARLGGRWVTPPVRDGLLPGIWRARFLCEVHAEERSLTLDDLLGAEEVVIGNSVRGAIPVGEIHVYRGGAAEPLWVARTPTSDVSSKRP